MITLGITGTLGAGKGAVVEYLMGKGFSHFSVRAYLLHEVRRRGLPENRDSTTLVANDLRKTHAPDFLVRELFEQAKRAGGDAIIESIRALGEIDYLKKNAMPFYFIAVDADPQLRYLRITKRGSGLDQVSFEKFLADEARESNNSDPWKQDLPACIARADFVLMNDGTFDDLHRQIDSILLKINASTSTLI